MWRYNKEARTAAADIATLSRAVENVESDELRCLGDFPTPLLVGHSFDCKSGSRLVVMDSDVAARIGAAGRNRYAVKKIYLLSSSER